MMPIEPAPKRARLNSKQLKQYLADYINEELDRGEPITAETIDNAFEAFEGGAR